MTRTVDQVRQELKAAHKVRDIAKNDVKQAVIFLSVAETRLAELLDEYVAARPPTDD